MASVSASDIRISIRAPHTGSDFYKRVRFFASCISIRAPHTGSDPLNSGGLYVGDPFQSALPIRGATAHRGQAPHL